MLVAPAVYTLKSKRSDCSGGVLGDSLLFSSLAPGEGLGPLGTDLCAHLRLDCARLGSRKRSDRSVWQGGKAGG